MIKALWARWTDYCARDEDARPQALVRLLIPLVILLDLGRVAQLGLLNDYFRPYALGGLDRGNESAYILDRFLPPEHAGLIAVVVTTIALIMVASGRLFRPAVLLSLLAYAQLGHLYSPGDRAIDRLLRTILMFWMFGESHKKWSLSRDSLSKIPAWPADLARFLLVLVYLSAALGKLLQQPEWLAWSGTPVLYRVMTDPLAAHMDPIALQNWFWPLRIAGWGTIVLELSSPLILTRWAPYWGLPAVLMHLGIFYTMDLGMFSWGMLALYPLIFARWIAPQTS